MCLGLPFASSAKRNRWVYKSLISREMGGDDGEQNKDNPSTSPNRPYQEKEEDMKLWGILLFGLIGATATTLAVSFIQFHLFSCYKCIGCFWFLIRELELGVLNLTCTVGFVNIALKLWVNVNVICYISALNCEVDSFIWYEWNETTCKT
jgi:hypothetical protein